MIRILKSALVLISLSSPLFAQNSIQEKLQGEWIKEEIKLADGSTLYDPDVLNSQLILHFLGKDSVVSTYNGQTNIYQYTVNDSVLAYRAGIFRITRLDPPILVLSEESNKEGYVPLQLKFTYKSVYDAGFRPSSYLSKKGEEVFLRIPGILEPKFVHPIDAPMNYIYKAFGYPEYKKGGFVLRFVITSTGKIAGARITASSNPKFDDKLVKALMKTKGKWIPAEYNGEKINCEVAYNFDLGYSNTGNENGVSKEEQSNSYAEYGDYYFDSKNYKAAINYFDKSIESNPYNIDAYYKRAASYIFSKDIKSACKDYEQLSILNQTKATELFEKYCNK